MQVIREIQETKEWLPPQKSKAFNHLKVYLAEQNKKTNE